MPAIRDAQLEVQDVFDHPGRRRLVVRYVVEVADDDPLIGRSLRARAVVHGIDAGDAPVPPRPVQVEVGDTQIELTAGRLVREHRRVVHRTDLDVEEDWWRADDAGFPEPIAELVDHLGGEVTLLDGEQEVARADLPVVTGSWGALGEG